MDAIVAKLRVFENGAQDNAGAWICHTFPGVHWMRSNFQTYAFGGPDRDGGSSYGLGPYTWEPYAYSALGQHHWDLEHVMSDHGPLGARYPLRLFEGDGRLLFKEGGGTVPWFGLLNRGLFDLDHPWWGGWSGRFTREKVENYWSRHDDVRADEEQLCSVPCLRARPATAGSTRRPTSSGRTSACRSGAGDAPCSTTRSVAWTGA